MLGLLRAFASGIKPCGLSPHRSASGTLSGHTMAFAPTSHPVLKEPSVSPCVPFPSTRFRSGLTLSSTAPAPRDLRVPLGALRPSALAKGCLSGDESRNEKIAGSCNFLGTKPPKNLGICCGQAALQEQEQGVGKLWIKPIRNCFLKCFSDGRNGDHGFGWR